MQICKTIAELKKKIKEIKNEGKTVGFVPTMGYLHEGHLSLMRQARKENDFVIISIFVNPTQFEPNEDLATYPRDLQRDVELAKSVGVELIFAPEAEEIYPENYKTIVEVIDLSQSLCGVTRPGHFKGVCTVVTKLFNIVQPDRAYFGQKDAQQVIIIRQMVKDLHIPVEVIAGPIVREADGLAMSSRNKYLKSEERQAALVLFKALTIAREAIQTGERRAELIEQIIIQMIAKEPSVIIDYVSVVSGVTLEKISHLEGQVLIALAVFIGKTRLIDNIMLEVA